MSGPQVKGIVQQLYDLSKDKANRVSIVKVRKIQVHLIRYHISVFPHQLDRVCFLFLLLDLEGLVYTSCVTETSFYAG